MPVRGNMEKVLSIIIPTYNMEALLGRCLDSLTASGSLPELDILVVNDGSTDGCSAIAHSYSDRYPQIRVIDKSNGNYGSAINAALPLAVGRFVKILDADDWFDTEALDRYIAELKALDSEADVSVTHFIIHYRDGHRETARYNVYGREPYIYGKVYDLDKVLSDGYIRFFSMHSLAYRTKLFLGCGYHQTEGISYTDMEWVSCPLFHARSIVFHNIRLYQYNLDRDGQTNDPLIIRKNLRQLEQVTFCLLEHFKQEGGLLSASRRRFFTEFYKNRIRVLLKTHLMDIPREYFDSESFGCLDSELRRRADELGITEISVYPQNKVIRMDAYKYWRRHGTRLPVWLEKVNGFADKVATAVYVRLFR